MRISLAVVLVTMSIDAGAQSRPRARDVGLRPGTLETGRLNAITDVAGVRVGHTTVMQGENVRTGVTAILPHGGNLFREKVPGAVVVANGFGKLAGSTQVNELGEIETPILLTSTLNVPRVKAVTVRGNGRVAEALPVERTLEILKRYAVVR